MVGTDITGLGRTALLRHDDAAWLGVAGGGGALRASTALSSLVAVAVLALPQPGRAAQECGAASNGKVTCTAAGNPYPNGITYTPAGDLALTTNPDVTASDTVSVQAGGATHVTNNGAIATTGALAHGISAGGSGVTVDGSGSIRTSGTDANGIRAVANGDGVTIDVGDVTTTGTGGGNNSNTQGQSGGGANAIFADAGSSTTGAVSITAGNLSTAGRNADGVHAVADGGDVTVNTGTISVSGIGASGVSAENADPGIFSSTPVGKVTITTGDIDVTGPVDPNSLLTPTGVNAHADTITVHTGDIKSTGNGITADGGYDDTSKVDVSFGSIAAGTGDFLTGVDASSGGDTTITGKDISVGGESSFAILGFASKHLTITSTGTISATDGAAGIAAYDGDINISVNNIHASSYAISVYAPKVAITVSGSVTSDVQPNSFDPHPAAITAQGSDRDGIPGTYDGISSIVTNNGTVSATADGARGIYVSADTFLTPPTTGAFSATVEGTGSTSTSGANGDAIFVTSAGEASVTQSEVTTTGAGSRGVVAMSTGDGSVAVDVGHVTVSGAGAVGILASGAGPVTVTTGGATTHDAAAVDARSSAGAVGVTLNGATTTGEGPAVIEVGGTTATLNIGASGSLAAAGGGAQLSSGSGATVHNAGSITGGDNPIVSATGGRLAFFNTGTFSGRIGFTGGNDTLDNSGTYDASFDQSFGAGTDALTNRGTFSVSSAATAARTVHLTGLESFSNSGTVDLRNGHTGDVLDMTGAFTGSGGSTLGIDVTIGAASDKLVTTGAITGSTTLVVTSAGAAGAALGSGTIFADGGEGSSPTAFTLQTEFLSSGFIQYGIAFDASDDSYSLSGIPSDAVFRTLKIGEGAQQLWYKSAEVWSTHMSDLRDSRSLGGAAAGRLWGQFYGQRNSRSTDPTFSVLGQPRTVNLSYSQDAFGGQLGLDLGRSGDSTFVFGVTGGYLSSKLNFRNSADRISFDTVNAGVYAGFASGGLFANILGKYDYSWVRSESRLVDYDAKLHGMSYGAQGEVGFRLGADAFYAEPVATLAYVRTDIRDLRALGATFDFDDLDGLRGKAGLRIGSKLSVGGGTIATIYAQGNYVHEFKGNNGLTFTSGAQSLGLRDGPIGDYGEGKLGFNITSGRVTGFIEGFGDYSDAYKGGGGRVGIRLNF